MIDLAWCGGISEARKIANLAEAAELPVTLHDCTGPIVFAASCALSATLPNVNWQEAVRAYYTGWYREIVADLPAVTDGRVAPLDGPGLGLRLRRRALHPTRRHRPPHRLRPSPSFRQKPGEQCLGCGGGERPAGAGQHARAHARNLARTARTKWPQLRPPPPAPRATPPNRGSARRAGWAGGSAPGAAPTPPPEPPARSIPFPSSDYAIITAGAPRRSPGTRGRRTGVAPTAPRRSARPAAANLPDKAVLIHLFEQMVLLRRFESVAQIACRKGETPGFLHLYIGEEATAVGVCAHLTADRLGHLDPPRPRARARQGHRPAAS